MQNIFMEKDATIKIWLIKVTFLACLPLILVKVKLLSARF